MQPVSGVVTLTGTGFGSAPNIVLFRRFLEGTDGSDLQETAPSGEIGNVTFNGTNGLPVYGTMSGRLGLYNHKVGASSEFWAGWTFPHARRVRVYYRYGIPPGKLHPGSGVTTPQTFSGSSDWKPLWLGYDANSFSGSAPNGDDKADLVIPTHNGNGGTGIFGNSVTIGQLWNQNTSVAANYWEWDALNGICYVQDCDSAAPSTAVSTQDTYFTNSLVNASKTTGTWHKSVTTVPSFNPAVTAEGTIPDSGAYYGVVRLGSFSKRSSTAGDNTQCFYCDLYIASESSDGADDYWQGVFLGNAANFEDCTAGLWIPPDFWNDTGCVFTFPDDTELTHYHVFKGDRTIESGARPA